MADLRLYNTLINNIPETDRYRNPIAEGQFSYFLSNGDIFTIKCLTHNYKGAYTLSTLSVKDKPFALLYVDISPTAKKVKRVAIDGVHIPFDDIEEEE